VNCLLSYLRALHLPKVRAEFAVQQSTHSAYAAAVCIWTAHIQKTAITYTYRYRYTDI